MQVRDGAARHIILRKVDRDSIFLFKFFSPVLRIFPTFRSRFMKPRHTKRSKLKVASHGRIAHLPGCCPAAKRHSPTPRVGCVFVSMGNASIVWTPSRPALFRLSAQSFLPAISYSTNCRPEPSSLRLAKCIIASNGPTKTWAFPVTFVALMKLWLCVDQATPRGLRTEPTYTSQLRR